MQHKSEHDTKKSKLQVVKYTNCWPTECFPIRGIFIVEQVESLSAFVDVKEVVVVKPIMRSLLLGYLKAAWRVARYSQTVDIVHVHHLLAAISMLFVWPLVRCPVVISLMNDPGANVKGIPSWLDRSLVYLCSVVFAGIIYKGQAPTLSRRVRSACIPNAVEASRFSSVSQLAAKRRLGLGEETRYLLFVSANDLNRPTKRKDLFDQVVSRMKHQGYAPLYMANVSRSEVPLYFAAATAFLLCSDVEGSPNAVKESLASGTPVVARDLPGVRYLLEGCPGTALFCEDDPDEIARLVAIVAEDSDAQAIRAHLKRLGLTPDSVARRIVELYDQVVACRLTRSERR